MEPNNFFDKINSAIRNSEASVVNLISSIAPWGAPMPAAYMSWAHMVGILNFPGWLAFAVAMVIEILGFSTVSTILSFWSHNRKYTDETKKSPIGLVIAAFIFYLGIVVTMNVLLDASAGQWWNVGAVIAVRALLTLMSIPAALVLAVRTQHHEMLTDFEENKRERAFKKHYGDQWFEMMYGQPKKAFSERSVNTNTLDEEKLNLARAYMLEFPSASTRDIAKAVGSASPATGKKYRDAVLAEQENG